MFGDNYWNDVLNTVVQKTGISDPSKVVSAVGKAIRNETSSSAPAETSPSAGEISSAVAGEPLIFGMTKKQAIIAGAAGAVVLILLLRK